ncbi:MAG: DUF4349 domain-containing protein [Spirochaetales bacterium]|nr:DUF4349 domain-containing protein [Spirochaetales bacterium]
MKQLTDSFTAWLFLIITLFFVFLTTCSKYDMQENSEVFNKRSALTDDEEDMKYDESGTDQPGDAFRGGERDDTERETGEREKQEERMLVYFGFLRLRVDNVKETRNEISSLADKVQGYVEASYEDTVIIRIPKELFAEILTALMEMGEVLNKSVETYDVTDIFKDFAARLEIAKKTRNRLYNLLEKTTDVKVRLKILKEIRRLSEEIETISMTLENIKRLISFSRITIQLEQRLTGLSYEDKRAIPFPWIAGLDPFYISLYTLKGSVQLKTGDEFAVFDNRKYFFAESTEGIRIRIASTKNKPEGDAGFWQRAVEYHLSRFYKTSEFLELGDFKAVQFMSKDPDPFYYIVGIMVKENKIFVCEILFPNHAAFEKFGEAVKGYIKEGRIK